MAFRLRRRALMLRTKPLTRLRLRFRSLTHTYQKHTWFFLIVFSGLRCARWLEMLSMTREDTIMAFLAMTRASLA